ncbi:MAG: tRNA (adenosine(37)-N6)-threonylcarbamoyltransferase complex dimerization subunit type 1 TsaB [Candidatus Reddybacter sp.]
MASLLSIDTSSTCCSVALSIDDKQLIKRTDTPREHVRLVLPMIDELLSDASIKLSALDAIAFTHGPGSFTGLRIGFGVVQGLAFGADLPVIALSTLRVMAQRAIRLTSPATKCAIIPAIDARMGELYWGFYRQVDGLAQPIEPDALCPQQGIYLQSFDEGADPGLANITSFIGVGDGWQYKPELSRANDVLELSAIYENIGPDAEDILPLAIAAFQAGRVAGIEDVEPVYLRNTISWKKRQRLRT